MSELSAEFELETLGSLGAKAPGGVLQSAVREAIKEIAREILDAPSNRVAIEKVIQDAMRGREQWIEGNVGPDGF